MNSRDIIFVKHILDAIKDIETSTNLMSKEKFLKSNDVKDACIRRLEIIGEAVKNISQEIKIKYSFIEWKKIAGTRDRVIHSYFSVDLDIVWDIITKELHLLKKQMEEIEKELEK